MLQIFTFSYKLFANLLFSQFKRNKNLKFMI